MGRLFWKKLSSLSNPARFMTLSGYVVPWALGLACVTLAAGLYMSFFTAPADYQQGETVRIMFIHVPSAWISLLCYSAMAVAAFGYLVWRHPLADVAIEAAAPLGAVFTFLMLVTGALWGKPMWGAYWVWDARLTSALITFLIYLGLIALRHILSGETGVTPARTARLIALLTLMGAVNIPIIHFSVDWWTTLHQPASVIRSGGSAIHPSLLWPLLVMALGMSFLIVALQLISMRTLIRKRHIAKVQTQLALTGSAPCMEDLVS